MAKNQEVLNRKLYSALHKFSPTTLDLDGKVTPVPEQADVFQFEYTDPSDETEYGKVAVSIDGTHTLKVYFDDNVANAPNWTKQLIMLKNWAHDHQLSFEPQNRNHLHPDMAQRKHMKNQEKIAEGYYPMGKKASYSDNVPEVKIILQHNRQLEEGEKRYRSIAKIFVENTDGERFLLPTIKPGIARVYARHIAEGGTPYDEPAKHIDKLVEEYTQMAGFVRATRNNQFNESAQHLVNEGINHYQSLRETLHKLAGRRGYNAYFESWTPTLTEDTEDATDLSEMFANSSLDPRIESVMPILRKLNKNINEMSETTELSEWADSIIDEATDIDLEEDQDVSEGWKSKLAGAALAGASALSGGGAQACEPGVPGGPTPKCFQYTPPQAVASTKAQFDYDTKTLTVNGKKYKWAGIETATGNGEVVNAPSMAVGSRSMGDTQVELNPNGTYTKASMKEQQIEEERTEVKDKDGKVKSWKDEGEWKKSTDNKDGRGKVTHLSDKARRETEQLAKAKQGMEESQLNELNRDTVTSYANKAEKDQDNQFTNVGKGIRDNDPKSANTAGHKFSMRSVGLNRAYNRLPKDEDVAEGEHTQHYMDANKSSKVRQDAEIANADNKPTDWKRDPIQSISDRIADLFRKEEIKKKNINQYDQGPVGINSPIKEEGANPMGIPEGGADPLSRLRALVNHRR